MSSLPASAYGHGAPVAVPAPVGLPSSTRVSRALKVEVDYEIRCTGRVEIRTRLGERKTCGKLLAEHAARPWQIKCARCGALNRSSQIGKGPGQ